MQKDVDQAVALAAAAAAAAPAWGSLECKDNIAPDLVNLPSLGRFTLMFPLFLAIQTYSDHSC